MYKFRRPQLNNNSDLSTHIAYWLAIIGILTIVMGVYLIYKQVIKLDQINAHYSQLIEQDQTIKKVLSQN